MATPFRQTIVLNNQILNCYVTIMITLANDYSRQQLQQQVMAAVLVVSKYMHYRPIVARALRVTNYGLYAWHNEATG